MLFQNTCSVINQIIKFELASSLKRFIYLLYLRTHWLWWCYEGHNMPRMSICNLKD
ncbi:unnamed protein product [Nezara viridula]|uniref:Uncharacterized protein n=1 Tax=Nezara viridula TaxID=85310 RepID=A0A9P0E880_NEZVI|nr:unnamed protein product [Nezara viridula]